MDPNEALYRIRTAVAVINARVDEGAEVVSVELASHLAKHFEALDGWLASGGFLPRSWH